MKRRYSILFAGTPQFAVPTLQALIECDAYQINGVISQPDKHVGRQKKITPPPIKTLALSCKLPLWQPSDINNEWVHRPEEFKTPFDFLVVVAFGQILRNQVLESPSVAPVNLHASLLPRWRGASPIQTAIAMGDKNSGVTVQRMVAKLDAGPILAQSETTITNDETAQTLHDRLAQMGANLLIDTLKHPLSESSQDEASVTVCQKLNRSDGFIDPETKAAEQIERLVRAMNPWPGVSTQIDGQTLKLIEVSRTQTDQSIPLLCKDNTILHLQTVQPSGRNRMSGMEWIRGKQ